MTLLLEKLTTYFSILFSISIGYYTLYGVSKSAIEYFCFQARPGDIVLQERFTQISYVTGNKNLTNFEQIINSAYTNDSVGFPQISIDWSNGSTTSYDHSPDVSYKKENDNYKILCYTAMYNGNYLKWLVVRDDGSVSIGSSMDFSSGINQLDCAVINNPKTCSIKKSTQDSFNLGYIMAISTSLLMMVYLDFLDYKFKLRKFLSKNFSFLTFIIPETVKLLSFCNPLSGEFVERKLGDIFIYKGSVDNLVGETASIFKTENILISCEGNIVFTCESGKAHSYVITTLQMTNFRKYLSLLYKDNNNFCVRDHHYITFKETLDYLTQSTGNYLQLGVFDSNYEIWGEAGFMYSILKSLNLRMKEEVIKSLCLHNYYFFGEPRLNELCNVINQKTAYYNRPEFCKNKQWKIYVSDCAQILHDLSSRIKFCTQGRFKLSNAYKNAMRDYQNFDFSKNDSNEMQEYIFEVAEKLDNQEKEIANEGTLKSMIDASKVKMIETNKLIKNVKKPVFGNFTPTNNIDSVYLEKEMFDLIYDKCVFDKILDIDGDEPVMKSDTFIIKERAFLEKLNFLKNENDKVKLEFSEYEKDFEAKQIEENTKKFGKEMEEFEKFVEDQKKLKSRERVFRKMPILKVESTSLYNSFEYKNFYCRINGIAEIMSRSKNIFTIFIHNFVTSNIIKIREANFFNNNRRRGTSLKKEREKISIKLKFTRVEFIKKLFFNKNVKTRKLRVNNNNNMFRYRNVYEFNKIPKYWNSNDISKKTALNEIKFSDNKLLKNFFKKIIKPPLKEKLKTMGSEKRKMFHIPENWQKNRVKLIESIITTEEKVKYVDDYDLILNSSLFKEINEALSNFI